LIEYSKENSIQTYKAEQIKKDSQSKGHKMATKTQPIVIEAGTLKVAMHSVYNYLLSIDSELLNDKAFTKLLVASKGGFSGEDSYITIDNKKVARQCAMTGAYFAHNNEDKSISYFYKNGSYMIGAEVVKANARKAWDIDKEAREVALEDDMLEARITPKEWKEQNEAIKAEQFDFTLDDDIKAQLIEDFNGYTTKEDFIEAYNNDEVAPFSDYHEEVEALRALAPKK